MNRINPLLPLKYRTRSQEDAQGMVEFALVVPLVLLLIVGAFVFAYLFYAWITIENAARAGVRYATTGAYNLAYCVDGPDAGTQACDGDGKAEEIDAARIPSIHDEASQVLIGLPFDFTVGQNAPGYIDITVCSGRSVGGTP
ncbi:MAG: TadE/TadG family type IV pilus assembly protein, partial [Chloroflexota bacterium]